jgi:hypothetical protein
VVTIRGILVSSALGWIKKHAGSRILPAALVVLEAEERKPFEGLILPFHKFALPVWDRLLAECCRLGAESLEISEAALDRRMIYEGGSEAMRLFFNAMVTIFDLDSVVSRLPQMHNRTYDPGSCEIAARTKTGVTLRYRTAPAARRHFRRYQALMLGAILETCGATGVVAKNIAEEDGGEHFGLTVEARFTPR